MSIEKKSALKYRSAQRKQKTGLAQGTRGSSKRSIPRDLTKAMKLFRDALKRDPHYARASVNLAMVQIAVGKPSKALGSLKDIKVNSGMLNLARGIALAEKGKYSKAAAAFATATKANATKRAATFNLARAYQLGKDKEKAKRYYQRYLRKYPKGPWAAAAKKAMKKL